jgi:RHS repeat-associated protein
MRRFQAPVRAVVGALALAVTLGARAAAGEVPFGAQPLTSTSRDVAELVTVAGLDGDLDVIATFGANRVAARPYASPSPTATPTPLPPALLLGPPLVPVAPRLGRSGAAITGDCNNDGQVTVDELIVGVNIALGNFGLTRCPSFDVNGDGDVTINELIQAVNSALTGPPPSPSPGAAVTSLATSSPANGEGDVAITRETILRFSAPLRAASVTASAIHADFAGAHLPTVLHVSPDGRTATLFYQPALPASARIRVTVDGAALRDERGRAVDADTDGVAGGVAFIDFDTLSLTSLPGTAVCGRVFASELKPGDTGTSVNVPLQGVTITVDGMEDTMRAVTDQFGNFRLEPAPVGRFFVHIDGRTATNGVPPGAYYPFVGKAWVSVAGVETNIGEIYLPRVSPGTLQPVSATQDTEIKFPPSVRADFPEFADVKIMVPANSLYSDDGTRGGMVGIAPVPPDRIPGPLPPGLRFPLVITVQTDGASNFDRPVPVCFPNLPDPKTGVRLAAGAESALWSFNHDTGQFEVVGPMTVSADGKLVCTNPGVGILAPGWHGTAPGAAGSGGPIGGPAGGDGPEKGGDSPPPGMPAKEKCKKNAGDDDGNVDPVYLFSGEFYEEVEDLRIPGRGLDFIWSRKYRSKIGPNTVQGNGWDFSYNIFIAAEGADVRVCDGNSRSDVFFRQISSVSAQGAGASNQVALPSYLRNEFFRELGQNSDDTYTMTFADQGTWVFNPLDGRPQQGKLRSTADRNGNTLTFAYDQLGRLSKVTDTLGRDVVVAYNTGGFIESVTDFSGRQVRYAYYQGGDAGGAPGDLKSVRSPVVTGTPNGNNFPNGKLTTYTYSKGFADDRLNHNLLTITDGRRNDPTDSTFGDGPYLVNVYGATENPDDVNFDRVVRQLWGGPNDIVDMVYVPQTPADANRQAFMKTIVRDRVGNVTEYFFERGNRVVIRRQYSGRADPDKPTTETANRPKNKLRPDDPDSFETQYEWSDDSLLKREIHPNGNITEYVHESDLNPDAPPRSRGNLRIVRRLAGHLAPVSDQDTIEERYEYDDRFGCGRCDGQFVTRMVDGRGNETRSDYDAHGNRIRIQHPTPSIVEDFEYNSFGQLIAHVLPDNGSRQRRRDQFTYYDRGAQRGYVRERVVDATGLRLSTTYEYDGVGNTLRRTDPRGHDTRYVVNALDQIIREVSREVTDGGGLRYGRDFAYDANNNRIRVDIDNIDEQGRIRTNARLTKTYEYDLLNMLVRRSDEVDEANAIVTEYAYDGNRNQTLVRFGEATGNRQPGNVRRTRYDERNLMFRDVRGDATGEQSTNEYRYDGNRNLRVVLQGLENAPHAATGVYDGFDRLVQLTDPMGNVAKMSYDAASNRVGVRAEGELVDVPGSSGNLRLYEVTYTYDAFNRLTRQARAFFDPRTQMPIGDGAATTQLTYSDASAVVRLVDDNGHADGVTYDSAHRVRTVTDAKGNTTTYEYDANSNVIRTRQVDRADLGSPDETFVTTTQYDNLDRPIAVVDNLGRTRRYGYDSRHDPVRAVDARGNVRRTSYDGVKRLTQTIHELTDTGDATGSALGTITTTQAWDDSSRLISRTDAKGNTTRYSYDALNRRTRVEYADGTRSLTTYDAHDEPITVRDANDSLIRNTFDPLNRLTQRSIQPGPSVQGTRLESFTYDGVSRLSAAQDEDARLTRAYDSLSNIVGETLNGATLASTYDGEGNQLTCTYPGTRQITTTYDALDRKQTIADAAGQIASYAFIGRTRIQRRDYGNGTRAAVAYDGGRRITQTTHTRTNGTSQTTLDDQRYTWDPADNRSTHANLLAGGAAQTFGYDSVDRLVRSATTPPAGAAARIDYDLDAAGNRTEVLGGADAGGYALSAITPAPADSQANQYTDTPFDHRDYDANGNLIAIDRPPSGGSDTVSLAYDYRNRMVSYADPATGVTATYAYDPLGRRIARTVNGATTRFFYDRVQEIEEQDAAGTTQATYVYGLFVDELLQMRRGTGAFFFHGDDLYNIRAVSDRSGTVVERYDYDDFGGPALHDPAGGARAQTLIGNAYLYAGRRYDAESGLYFLRARYLDPRAGRFLTRDPLGAWADPLGSGNPYAYVGNNPTSRVDPLGLFAGGGAAAAAANAIIDAATAGATGAGAGATAGATTGGAAIPGLVGGATGTGLGTGSLTAGTVASAGAGAIVGAVAVGAVVGVGVGTAINWAAEDFIQAGLDGLFGDENMPEPFDADTIGADDPTEEGDPVNDDPEIDGEPVDDPEPAPADDGDDEAGGDAGNGQDEDCRPPCPRRRIAATQTARTSMNDACALAEASIRTTVPAHCPLACTRFPVRGHFPWECKVVCVSG